MSLPLIAQNMLADTANLLNPSSNLKRLVRPYHNSVDIKGSIYKTPQRIHLFGVGKSASFEVDSMLKIFYEAKLQSKIGQVVCITKEGHVVDNKDILQLEGDHPVVSERNIKNTKQFIKCLSRVDKEDTVLFFLSGGASALLELPVDEISFVELQQFYKDLLNSGENINQMNAKRKQISKVKNGQLLQYIPTDHIIQFLTCDIPDESLHNVGSGPLLSFDPVTQKSSGATTYVLQSGSTFINNLCQLKEEYTNKGIYDGLLAPLLEDISHNLPPKNKTYISGGEATISLPKNHGLGGRNTHFVLALADKVYQDPANKNLHILSYGTDGSDGPTDAAGAYINYDLFKSLEAQPDLDNFNSYNYFSQLGTLIKTGPTKTNVMDIRAIWRD